MINIAIIDDQKESQDLIVQTLKDSIQLTNLDYNCETYSTGEAFLNSHEISKYNILILDIEMPGISGVEVAKKLLGVNKNLVIVFLTSYENHMKDAFGLNVHNYILKENMFKELPSTITELMLDASKTRRKVTFNTNHGLVGVYEDDIVCVIFENRSPVIYTKNLSLVVYGESLYKVYERLSSQDFVQPNSGSIVNVKYIKTIRDNMVYLKHHVDAITISRGRLKSIKQKHIEYLVGGESL